MKTKTKFTLTPPETKWLTLNLHTYTSKQQFDYIMANRAEADRACYTTFRTALYSKGLKKCAVLKWTEKETQFLLKHYKDMGNIAIASKLKTKKRPFTCKNVEKKMQLLKIKRTASELDAIVRNHQKNGTYVIGNAKMWAVRGKHPDGERRVWVIGGTPKIVIKVNGIWVHYARHRFVELHGEVKPGYKVYLMDGNPFNVEDANIIQLPAGTVKMNRYKKHIKNYVMDQKLKQTQIAIETKTKSPEPHAPKGIAVRIDRKTVVYVKPGTNIEAFKKQYENRPII